MVKFELTVSVDRRPEDVFAFLLYKDRFPQPPGSPVLVLEKLTPGRPAVGTRYREVVRIAPWCRGEVLSTLTRYEPARFLAEDFIGPGPMRGHLAYEFVPSGGGTLLIQSETLEVVGPARMFSGLLGWMLGRRLQARLDDIKAILESGWRVDVLE